ncbi:MAG: alpha/beta hydrolase, partial [Candidatus Nanopelagicales bacterium]
MSTPPFLDLPPAASRITLPTSRGPLVGWRIEPEDGVEPRGTVLLVPGFTGSKEDFVAVLEPLAHHGWAVVTYDQRGQYESSGPDDEAAYSLASLARDLLEVVEGIGGPVHLVGHSFGGLVSREAVLTSGGAPFRSLTLLCSGPSTLPPQHHEGLGALHAALPHVPLSVIFDVRESQDREAGIPAPPPEVAEFLRERFVATNPYQLRAAAGILLGTPDRTDELAALARDGHLQVAVVYGPDDDAWDTAEQERVAAAVGARVVVVDGTGHSPAVDDPHGPAAALDELLTSVARGRP